MFLNQCIYYYDGIDTYPVKILKVNKKTLVVSCLEFTKRVKITSCTYQKTEGGFINIDDLELLLLNNSKNAPKKWIMGDKLCSFDCGVKIEENVTYSDFAIYPQVTLKEYR